MRRGHLTTVIERDDTGYGVVFEVCVDETNETYPVLRENIIGNHWCVGWHGYVKFNERKEIEFHPDR